MKRETTNLHRWLALVLVLLVAAILSTSATLAQTGGGYELTWSTIDAGGGNSVGGSYQLVGTLGQPDAGVALSGGNYSLAGGFWGGTSTPDRTLHLPLVRR